MKAIVKIQAALWAGQALEGTYLVRYELCEVGQKLLDAGVCRKAVQSCRGHLLAGAC
jgi:hypothetical protein